MIGIVDYGLGNVKAFANIYKELGVAHRIAQSAADLDGVSRIILPGVGAFDQAMKRLRDSGMFERVSSLALDAKVPTLGVCVGMQILLQSSEEGTAAGLGWIEGRVVRFEATQAADRVWVPHMGWNDVRVEPGSALFREMTDDARFYFLHSYFCRCDHERNVVARTVYGAEFACAVSSGNIHGVQFHPEKSHQYGVKLLRNFAEL